MPTDNLNEIEHESQSIDNLCGLIRLHVVPGLWDGMCVMDIIL